MNTELIECFDVLNILDKREQIYNELEILNQLIKQKNIENNIEDMDFDIKKYSKIQYGELDESEFLTFLYEDIYLLVKKIMMSMSEDNFN